MTEERDQLDRRSFMGTAIGAAAGLGASALLAGKAAAQPAAPQGAAAPNERDVPPSMRAPQRLYRLEADVRDCEVEGRIPTDLNGAFYRVGPDAQYPLRPGNIPFDGEGHVSMFRIKDGRVDYRSRFVRNERYLAQDKA